MNEDARRKAQFLVSGVSKPELEVILGREVEIMYDENNRVTVIEAQGRGFDLGYAKRCADDQLIQKGIERGADHLIHATYLSGDQNLHGQTETIVLAWGYAVRIRR